MKKQKTRFKSMRVAAALMMMTLVTSSVVWGTYAKYSTSLTGVDQARIAKFGVNIVSKGTTFMQEYASDNNSSITAVKALDFKTFAPGTSGEMTPIQISGKPEVSIDVQFVGEFAVTNWDIPQEDGSTKFYCPIAITIGNETITGTDFRNASEFEAAVNKAIKDCSGKYYVDRTDGDQSQVIGYDLSQVVVTPTLKWRWEFEGEHINDEYDTILGNRACEESQEGTDKIATIVVSITTTVTQID